MLIPKIALSIRVAMSILSEINFSRISSLISVFILLASMTISSRIFSALMQILFPLSESACEIGFKSFLNSESSTILNGLQFTVTISK